MTGITARRWNGSQSQTVVHDRHAQPKAHHDIFWILESLSTLTEMIEMPQEIYQIKVTVSGTRPPI
jgi:hypothetical protein